MFGLPETNATLDFLTSLSTFFSHVSRHIYHQVHWIDRPFCLPLWYHVLSAGAASEPYLHNCSEVSPIHIPVPTWLIDGAEVPMPVVNTSCSSFFLPPCEQSFGPGELELSTASHTPSIPQ